MGKNPSPSASKMSNWTEQVYKPDIIAKAETIYKKPGYDPR
jgi:4-oxalocrotonate tautomerase